jgi:hypothetical protein
MSEMLDNVKENVSQLLNKCDKVMHLKIFVEGSYNLKKMYYAAVDKHNKNLLHKKK